MPILRLLLICCLVVLEWCFTSLPAQAMDLYVQNFLKATVPVPIKLNPANESQLVTPEALSRGKDLFKESCINCHVGGNTLPNPPVSLSLTALQGATPPRDSLTTLVAYMREPMNYDGSDYGYLCRQVTEAWMSQAEIESLAAFILRAAAVAPGWGTERFDEETS